MEVHCPRCAETWSTSDEDGGSTRLCPTCVQQLKVPGTRPRPLRDAEPGHHEPAPITPADDDDETQPGVIERLGWFTVILTVLLVVGVALIVLGKFVPDPFRGALLVYGIVVGLLGIKWFEWESQPGDPHDVDYGRQVGPMLLFLLGLACVAAWIAFNRQDRRAGGQAALGIRRPLGPFLTQRLLSEQRPATV